MPVPVWKPKKAESKPDPIMSAPVQEREPVPAPDPTVRFVEVLGVERPMGICLRCNRRGRIGNFCYRCCYAANMEMGTCLVCADEGPITTWCQSCEEAPYEERTDIGTCPRCGDEGARGGLCSECEDMALCYE